MSEDTELGDAELAIAVTGVVSGATYTVPLSTARTVYADGVVTTFKSGGEVTRSNGLRTPAHDLAVRESVSTVLSLIEHATSPKEPELAQSPNLVDLARALANYADAASDLSEAISALKDAQEDATAAGRNLEEAGSILREVSAAGDNNGA